MLGPDLVLDNTHLVLLLVKLKGGWSCFVGGILMCNLSLREVVADPTWVQSLREVVADPAWVQSAMATGHGLVDMWCVQ